MEMFSTGYVSLWFPWLAIPNSFKNVTDIKYARYSGQDPVNFELSELECIPCRFACFGWFALVVFFTFYVH